jgi:hypothetical protein
MVVIVREVEGTAAAKVVMEVVGNPTEAAVSLSCRYENVDTYP